MKLSKVKLKNFKCFGPKETVIDLEDLTAIIGNNSSGKTAFSQALIKLFANNQAEATIARADFHVPREKEPEDIEESFLSIEAVFTFPELNDQSEPDESIPIFFKAFVVDETGQPPYIRIRLESSWKQSSNPDGSIDTKIFYITASEHIDDADLEDKDKHNVNRHDLSHIGFYYVPANRNPESQLRSVSGSILWRVLKNINWSQSTKENTKAKLAELDTIVEDEQGFSLLKDAVKDQWEQYHQDYRYSNAGVSFEKKDFEGILKKIEVKFSPTEITRDYSIEELGDGLRSLFYISLVNSLLEIENMARVEQREADPCEDEEIKEKAFNIAPPVLTILAVEEPENHIAPHLLGKVMGNLRKISLKENAQIMVTSHSPAIIRRIEPESIRYFRIDKDTLHTKVKKVILPKQNDSEMENVFKYVKEAIIAYPEIYFARLVVLGEGDSEEIVLPKIINLLGTNIDSAGISVVPLGGRHINHFWRLLNELEIPHITLLDLDRERNGGGWGRIKYVLKQLIENGTKREKLLELKDGSVLSDERLEEMHEWDIDSLSNMKSWIKFLEKYNVFFAQPLDLDFMMLEAYEDSYKNILEANEGPFIKGKGKILKIEVNDPDLLEYKDRIKHDIGATLKSEGGDGHTYSEYQRSLMVWYNYFFLGRGKPTTHMLALLKINEEDLKDSMPPVLKRLLKAVKAELSKDPYSTIRE